MTSKTDTPAEAPTDELAIRHFGPTEKALHDLVGLFVTGPLKKEGRRSEVRAAISALAQIAKDRAPKA